MNPELKPLADLIESLSREMQEGFRRLEGRLDVSQRRLDLHGGKIRAGSVWVARMDAWSDNVDHSMAKRDKQIEELYERVAKLEAALRKNGSSI
jgi:hypothetical protein